MRGKHTSDDLAKSIYRFNDANPDYANSAIARIFSISESTLRGILKRRLGGLTDKKMSNWVKYPTPHCKNHEAMACTQRYSCSGLVPIFSRFEPYRTCVSTRELFETFFSLPFDTLMHMHTMSVDKCFFSHLKHTASEFSVHALVLERGWTREE